MKNKLGFLIFFIILISCGNKEKVIDIYVREGNEYFSSKDSILIFEATLTDEKVKKTKIVFDKKDWQLLNTSFKKNQIYLFDSINYDIGKVDECFSTSILLKKVYLITNKRKIRIDYNNFLEPKELNINKTQRYKKFRYVLDSIIEAKYHAAMSSIQ